MADWSSERFQCSWCGKLLRGYVPKNGDGTGFLLPHHKDQGTHRCQGTGQMFNVGDGAALKGASGDGGK